jgi:hypothetical protein
MDFSTEGGELTGYYDGDRLRLLEALYLGEGGRAKYQYYFWGDSLFFVFSVEEYYARPIYSSPNDSVPPPRIPRHLENRFYFARGKLVRWIDSAGHPRRVLDTAAVRWEDQLRSGAVFLARCAASSAADSLACADTTN